MFSNLLQNLTLPGIFLLLGAGFLVYYAAWIIFACYFHPYADIPGPSLAKISRFWIGASVGKGNAEHTQRTLHRDLGPLVRIAHDEISVSDPDAVKIIYNVKSGFTKTDFYPPFAPKISSHGDHFTQLDERKHAERRKFVNHIYSMSTILESEKYINACGDVFLEKMAAIAKEGKAIDFGEWIQWYTFDVIGELFFGHQFGFMKDEHDYSRYIESLDTLLPGIAMSCVLPAYLRPFHSTVGLIFPSIRASIKGFDEIRAAGNYWTSDRLQKRQSEKFERTDLLEKFFIVKDQREGWDIPDIANEACVAIFAGSDTTAVAMRSIFYHLMKNRDTLARLVAEIDDFDVRGEISHPHVTYAEAIKMPYLVACCKEGMRLHPSVGLGMPRHVAPGGATIAGRYFPGGSKVSINAAVLHYDKSVFGADADQFKPERWIEGDASNMDKHMLHFGGGSRTCLGKNISLAEMHKLIPTFLRKFDVALVEPDKEWETHNFWFNKQLGINVKVTQRSLLN